MLSMFRYFQKPTMNQIIYEVLRRVRHKHQRFNANLMLARVVTLDANKK